MPSMTLGATYGGGASSPFAAGILAGFVTGEVAGSTSAVQFESRVCEWVKFKAKADNAGTVAIGPDSTVTLPGGTTDWTSGWPLAGGEETEWMHVQNLNQFWYICTNAGDDISIWIV